MHMYDLAGRAYPLEPARSYQIWLNRVQNGTSGLTDEQQNAVAMRCLSTGEAVWHAMSQVFKTPCHCANCEERHR